MDADVIGDLLNEPERLQVAGQTVTVRRVTVRQLKSFLPLFGPVREALSDLTALLKSERAVAGEDVIDLIDRHSEPLAAATANLIDVGNMTEVQRLDWLLDLELNDFVMVVCMTARINAGFFIKRLRPELQGIAAALISIGQMLSTSWPGTDTAPNRSSIIQ